MKTAQVMTGSSKHVVSLRSVCPAWLVLVSLAAGVLGGCHTVHVRDMYGKPLEGVAVRALYSDSTGPTSYTNGDGKAEVHFDRARPPRDLAFSKEGYLSGTRPVDGWPVYAVMKEDPNTRP